MSFVPVYTGATLASDGDAMMFPDLVVGSMSVEVSIDNGVNWDYTAMDSGNGIWTAMGLPLTADVQSELQVRLTINGENKTTDGTATGGNAIFLLTPGSMSMTMP